MPASPQPLEGGRSDALQQKTDISLVLRMWKGEHLLRLSACVRFVSPVLPTETKEV